MNELELGHPTSLNFLTDGHIACSKEEGQYSFEAINQFFFKKLSYFISAEINNPITIINSHLHELQSGIDKKTITMEQLQASLDRIKNSNQKVARIIKQLKYLFESDGTRHSSQAVFLRQIVNDVLDLSQSRLLQHQIKVFHTVDPKLIVSVRAEEIMQILFYLIENALKANQDKSSSWIQIEARKVHDMAILSMWDSGLGLTEDKFSQAILKNDLSQKAIIHGLPVSAQLAAANKGSLEISNSSGITKLHLSLPLFKL